MKPYVPLGILYLTSHLRAQASTSKCSTPPFVAGASYRAFLESEKPAVLGVYANLMTRGSVVRILKAAKEAGLEDSRGRS